MSIALMNIAQQMTPSASHRFSPMISCAAGAGAKWMKCGTSMAAYLVTARLLAPTFAKRVLPAPSIRGDMRRV
jgi:hypothetical protein